MPSTFDLPRKDKVELGDMLYASMDGARRWDLAPVYTQAAAVRQYLDGSRNFVIEDPFLPGYSLMEVSSPRDQPAWESLVSDVSQELGRQLRMDESPRVGDGDLTLMSIRDRAVGAGTLSYLFPHRVTAMPHHAFQKYRVEQGCAGITVYPVNRSTGWGLELRAIPAEELIFLPVGCRSMNDVEAIIWRKWVTLKWLRKVMASLAYEQNDKINPIPQMDTDKYRRMNVISVQAGTSIQETRRGLSSSYVVNPLLSDNNIYGAGQSVASDQTEASTKMVELCRCYVTRDRRYLERCIFQVGRHVLYDKEWNDGEMPLMPVAVSQYAAVGGPYGRSYAFPRMGMCIAGERFLLDVARNARQIDAYGMILMSTGMGFDTQELERPSDGGARFGQYTRDPAEPGANPIRFEPNNLARSYGNLPQYFAQLPQTVYPSSPLFDGKTSGRIDSDVALRRLEVLSNTSIAAGSITAAEAFAQVYACGLEMATNHYQPGDKVPLTYVSDEMAGVVLDTEELPRSLGEQQQEDDFNERQASLAADHGLTPEFAAVLAHSTGGMTSSPVPSVGQRQRMAVPRFTIGPNVVPHPDKLNITISSFMPRDKALEFQTLDANRAKGYLSAMEVQIECYKRGIDQNVGGKANWYTYQMAILNLLSAFGNGVESGPILVPPMGGVPRVAYWTVSTFMCSPVFLLASETVKQAIMQLQGAYTPTNMGPQTLTPDESAIIQDQRMRSGMLAMSGMPQGNQMGGPGMGMAGMGGMNGMMR